MVAKFSKMISGADGKMQKICEMVAEDGWMPRSLYTHGGIQFKFSAGLSSVLVLFVQEVLTHFI